MRCISTICNCTCWPAFGTRAIRYRSSAIRCDSYADMPDFLSKRICEARAFARPRNRGWPDTDSPMLGLLFVLHTCAAFHLPAVRHPETTSLGRVNRRPACERVVMSMSADESALLETISTNPEKKSPVLDVCKSLISPAAPVMDTLVGDWRVECVEILPSANESPF